MKPTEILSRDVTPEGEELLLLRRDSVYTLRVDGMELMSSRAHGSEEELARLACRALGRRRRPRVLIGGLGFGYTLRTALDNLPADATVIVCELFASILEWNRGALGHLAGRPLADRRVAALRADVRTMVGKPGTFDVIILDIDNGPWGFTVQSNDELYSAEGIARLARSLAAGGVLAVWSSEPSAKFERRLSRAGLTVSTETVAARGGGKAPRHTIFVGVKQ